MTARTVHTALRLHAITGGCAAVCALPPVCSLPFTFRKATMALLLFMVEGMPAELLWFLLGLVLILSELVLPGFVMIFFGIGAWITALGVLVGVADAFNVQLLLFLVSSILSLVLFRKQGKKYFRGRVSHTLDDVAALDDVRGGRAIVVEDIVPSTLSGRVEFHGTLWKAIADGEIKKGTPVEILERHDLTLKVKPLS